MIWVKRRVVSSKDGAAGAVAAAVATRSSLAEPPTAAKRPNILWIMSDEHNCAITGAYGNNVVQTPKIDSLVASGVTFDTHYCSSPVAFHIPCRSFVKRHVKRLTIYQSKGFEFPVVFLMGLTQAHFGASELIRHADDFDGVTRAILYVAVTRPRDALYMSAPGRFVPQIAGLDRTLIQM